MIMRVPKISRFLLFLGMVNKDDNIGRRTVATKELVETIMDKLGITRPIEELVESYNRTLPLGFPIFLLKI